DRAWREIRFAAWTSTSRRRRPPRSIRARPTTSVPWAARKPSRKNQRSTSRTLRAPTTRRINRPDATADICAALVIRDCQRQEPCRSYLWQSQLTKDVHELRNERLGRRHRRHAEIGRQRWGNIGAPQLQPCGRDPLIQNLPERLAKGLCEHQRSGFYSRSSSL